MAGILGSHLPVAPAVVPEAGAPVTDKGTVPGAVTGTGKPVGNGPPEAAAPGKDAPVGSTGGELAPPDTDIVVEPPKPEPPSYVNQTEEDLQGVPGFLGGSMSAPTLPVPLVDTAMMMMTLAKLQQRMSDESLKLGEEALKAAQKDVEDINERRATEFEKYWNDLEKSRSRKSMGLFGVIADFFKKLFSGDIGGAFKTLVDNIGPALADIAKLIGAVLSIVLAAGVTAISAGGGAAALGLAIAGMALMVSGMIMGDPGIQKMIMEALPEDQRQGAMWALFAVALALQIAGSIMQCCANPAELTKLGALVKDMTTAVTTIVQGAVSISSGVEGKKATDSKASAMETQAQLERTKALLGKIQALQSRDISELKAILDSFASILSSTADMMKSYGQGYKAAASV